MCHLKSDNLIVERVLHNVVAFYQGGANSTEAYELPLTRLYRADNHAARIAKESRKAASKRAHG